MELRSSYTEEQISQVENYVVKLHQYVCSIEFQEYNLEPRKDKFYAELYYALHFAQITRQIFLNEPTTNWIALQVNVEKARRDGCIKAYKIPSKKLLFSIFNIQKEVHFQQATLYRGRGSFQAIDGYGFVTMDKYLARKENPLITNTKNVIDFIAVEYDKKD
jgi:hypothetical protein